MGLPGLLSLLLMTASLHAADVSCPDGGKIEGCMPPDCFERGCTIEGNGNKMRHGPWTEWYLNGQKHKEGLYTRGREAGQWTWWYPSGIVMQRGKFFQGKPSGKWSYFDENGKPEHTEGPERAKARGDDPPGTEENKAEDFAKDLNKVFK